MSDTRASKRQKTANGRHLDVPVPQKEVEKKIEEIARPRKKRPLPKPEYEDIWESVYLSGTEWAQIDQVYDIEWDFEHLDEALTDGELVGKTVHLFGSTEPQLIMMDKDDIKGSVIPVPVIVAVDCPRPPPSMIGIKSVQRAEEEIIPMSKLKMSWHPFVPDYLSGSRRFKPNVHVLRCEQRRARLRNMSEAAVHKYDYVLPYLIRPGQEEEVEPDTDVIVDVQIERDGQEKPLMMNFDYELDDLEEFVEEQIEANDLDKDKHTDLVKTAIQKAVRAAKLKYKAEKEDRKKRIEEIPQEDREAMKKLRLLKFYPQNEWPNISSVKSKYVNRYYGQADKVL